MTEAKVTRDLIVDLFRLKTTVVDVISELQKPEAAAEFYVSTLPAYGAIMEIWKHVRSVLQTEGKSRQFKTSNGKVVSLEPSRYDYDLEAIKAIAPGVIVDEPVPQSEEMQQINRLAQEMFDQAKDLPLGYQFVQDYAEEFMRLSQAKTIEKVDGRKLAGILGRGDQMAQDLVAKQVKVPVEYRIVVK